MNTEYLRRDLQRGFFPLAEHIPTREWDKFELKSLALFNMVMLESLKDDKVRTAALSKDWFEGIIYTINPIFGLYDFAVRYMLPVHPLNGLKRDVYNFRKIIEIPSNLQKSLANAITDKVITKESWFEFSTRDEIDLPNIDASFTSEYVYLTGMQPANDYSLLLVPRILGEMFKLDEAVSTFLGENLS